MNKMTNNQSSDAINDLTADINSFGIFVGFFAVGFVLILISWTCLVCCCCCPGCCPSKCCQKPDNEPYTKCELYWPAIFLILLLLLIIIVSAIGRFFILFRIVKGINFQGRIERFTMCYCHHFR